MMAWILPRRLHETLSEWLSGEGLIEMLLRMPIVQGISRVSDRIEDTTQQLDTIAAQCRSIHEEVQQIRQQIDSLTRRQVTSAQSLEDLQKMLCEWREEQVIDGSGNISLPEEDGDSELDYSPMMIPIAEARKLGILRTNK